MLSLFQRDREVPTILRLNVNDKSDRCLTFWIPARFRTGLAAPRGLTWDGDQTIFVADEAEMSAGSGFKYQGLVSLTSCVRLFFDIFVRLG